MTASAGGGSLSADVSARQVSSYGFILPRTWTSHSPTALSSPTRRARATAEPPTRVATSHVPLATAER